MLTRCEAILRDVCESFGTELRELNGEGDHVRLLVHYPPKIALPKLVNSLKGVSSRYLRAEHTGRINRTGTGSVFWSPSPQRRSELRRFAPPGRGRIPARPERRDSLRRFRRWTRTAAVSPSSPTCPAGGAPARYRAARSSGPTKTSPTHPASDRRLPEANPQTSRSGLRKGVRHTSDPLCTAYALRRTPPPGFRVGCPVAFKDSMDRNGQAFASPVPSTQPSPAPTRHPRLSAPANCTPGTPPEAPLAGAEPLGGLVEATTGRVPSPASRP
ncbi:Transposase IS200 like [Streptomyces sp. OV198]|jgi:hypothetical protein|nr:Transposase IS200 like [Streptomyces sp. OV198]